MRLSGRTSYSAEFRETARDFLEAAKKFPLASNLATQDILARYRGSLLGPWWITLATLTLVLGIGVNYAALFHQPVDVLLPYVALGLVIWGYLSASISEGGEAFVSGASMIRQSSIPLTVFILRCQVRNFINLAHQAVIVIGVMVWFRIFPGPGVLWALPGLLLITVNAGWLSLMLAMVSARFRDMPQIIAAVLQLLFFLSPIIWRPTDKLLHIPLVTSNPFYFSVETVREPLLHGVVPSGAYAWLIPIAIVGWVATVLTYNQTRRRVVHYL